MEQARSGNEIAGVCSRPFNDTARTWSVFGKEIVAIMQACERYPVLPGPGIRAVFSPISKNVGERLTTLLANVRVSGKVRRCMASLGGGFARVITVTVYSRWRKLDRRRPITVGLREKRDAKADPAGKPCVDFAFSNAGRVKYRRGRFCNDAEGKRKKKREWRRHRQV